jgi:tetratricopeptide (TPR) repeat protein
MEKLEYTYHVPLYRGHIAALRGDLAGAEAHWQVMRDKWPEDWITWSCIGDAYVKMCRYDEAVVNFEKAAALEVAPRYIDNWESIAEIRAIQKRYAEAAEAYDKVADIQTGEWNMSEEGFAVRKYRDLARKMREMA